VEATGTAPTGAWGAVRNVARNDTAAGNRTEMLKTWVVQPREEKTGTMGAGLHYLPEQRQKDFADHGSMSRLAPSLEHTTNTKHFLDTGELDSSCRPVQAQSAASSVR